MLPGCVNMPTPTLLQMRTSSIKCAWVEGVQWFLMVTANLIKIIPILFSPFGFLTKHSLRVHPWMMVMGCVNRHRSVLQTLQRVGSLLIKGIFELAMRYVCLVSCNCNMHAYLTNWESYFLLLLKARVTKVMLPNEISRFPYM